MKEYIFIIAATLLFSVQFLFTKKYQTVAGTAIEAAFFHKMIAPGVFILILFCYNHFEVHITPFSLIISLAIATIYNCIMVFSLMALSRGSVANYSLYLLCGGMVLPVLYGAAIGDPFDIWKILSLILIMGAIAVKYDRNEKTDKRAYLCFAMLFFLNGLSALLATVHQSPLFTFEKVSPVELMMLNSVLTIGIGAIVFVLLAAKRRGQVNIKVYAKAAPWAMGEGILNGLANLLLLLSLKTLAPSLQYPIVTGGSIFLSAVFGFAIYKEKIDKRIWLAVILAITGTIVMALGDLCF